MCVFIVTPPVLRMMTSGRDTRISAEVHTEARKLYGLVRLQKLQRIERMFLDVRSLNSRGRLISTLFLPVVTVAARGQADGGDIAGGGKSIKFIFVETGR